MQPCYSCLTNYPSSMLRIGSLVWGVKDVARSIEFWCAALDYKPAREPSEDWAILVPASGEGQQMAINLVSSAAETRQRHHLDLYAADRDAEVERLLSIGAKNVDWRYPDGADYVVLADPDGNKFCVIEKKG
jgi:catechol 2,3-dioxygenase-like lactoylglutathione lyase family enzyme